MMFNFLLLMSEGERFDISSALGMQMSLWIGRPGTTGSALCVLKRGAGIKVSTDDALSVLSIPFSIGVFEELL